MRVYSMVVITEFNFYFFLDEKNIETPVSCKEGFISYLFTIETNFKITKDTLYFDAKK